MTTPNIPVGRRHEGDLLDSLKNLLSSIDEFDSDLPYVNDDHLYPQAAAFVQAARDVLIAHQPNPRSTIADDLAGLMGALLTFRIPHSDADLGRTVGLDRLRKNKGLLIAGLVDAADAAARMGIYTQKSPLPSDINVEISRPQIEPLLRGVLARLSAVERSLKELNSKTESQASFAQQKGLLSFYIGSMRVEINIAKLHLMIGDRSVDFNSLSRAVEAMSELSKDFAATVHAWRSRLTEGIVEIAQRLNSQVRKVATGVTTTIRFVLRRAKRSAPIESAAIDVKERLSTDYPQGKDEDDWDKPQAPLHTSSPRFAPYLPYLRRYARALTGDHNRGDAFVVAMLESSMQASKGLERGVNTRVFLYRLLTRMYNFTPVEIGDAQRDPSSPERRLLTVARHAREAFLLVAMEGFSEGDAANILDSRVEEVRRFVDQAGWELGIHTDVLVIEDERIIAEDIVHLVKELGHRVIGVARTHSEALALVKITAPGLIVADIQLADGSSGLDAVNEILMSTEVPVIFVTAYPERYLVGSRPEPAFLIAKPFQPSTLKAVVTEALLFQKKARSPKHPTFPR